MPVVAVPVMPMPVVVMMADADPNPADMNTNDGRIRGRGHQAQGQYGSKNGFHGASLCCCFMDRERGLFIEAGTLVFVPFRTFCDVFERSRGKCPFSHRVLQLRMNRSYDGADQNGAGHGTSEAAGIGNPL